MEVDPLMREVELALSLKGTKKIDFCAALNITTQRYNNWRERGIPKGSLPMVATYFGWDVARIVTGQLPSQINNDTPPPLIKTTNTGGVAEPTSHYSHQHQQEQPTLDMRVSALPQPLRTPIYTLIENMEAIAAAWPKN